MSERQRLGHGSVDRSPTGRYAPSTALDPAVGERACGPSRPRRAACRRRGRGSPASAASGRPGTSPASSSRIAASESGSSARRVEVAGGPRPSRAAVEELRAGEGDDADRQRPRPVEQVLDEVEQARVGPLEVLEDEHRRCRARRCARRRCRHAANSVVAAAGRRRLEAEQREQRAARSSARSSGVRRRTRPTRRRDPLAGGRLVVGLGQAGAAADHLAQRPEA